HAHKSLTLVIVSRSPQGLQRHLSELELWCYNNFLSLSPSKSEVMIFGSTSPGAFPRFIMNGNDLRVVEKFKYVGVTFTSTHRDIFDDFYSAKARAARSCAHGVLGTERIVGRGRLPAKCCQELYTALVDCHLISGAEIVRDVSKDGIELLVKEQVMFLRRMLGLSSKSITTPLFTETGLRPIRIRRAILALSYLKYLLQLPLGHYARTAIESSFALRQDNSPSWVSDLDLVLRRLPGNEVRQLFLPQRTDLCALTIDGLVKEIRRVSSEHLLSEINSFHRLSLLRGRIEPIDPNSDDKPSSPVLRFRHYLHRVSNHRHRRSLTRLLAGNVSPFIFHCSPGRSYMEGDNVDSKQCRLCRSTFETPEHVMLSCRSAGDIVLLRREFLQSNHLDPDAQRSCNHVFELLRGLIFSWELVPATAKFVHECLIIWKDTCNIPRIDECYEDERE
ncbi:hypothetical protein K435DRAFT_660100, partial [Dendrothele bispora CBS 962.96]